MKNINKKMIMSILTLVLTIIALGTTTFAWFSLSTVSRVNNISGDVTAGDGLEIRLTGDNEAETPWKSNIAKTEVETFIATVFGSNKFDAVTTTDIIDFNKMKQNPNGTLTLDETAVKNKDYLEFDIHFRSQKGGTVSLINLIFAELAGEEFEVDGDPYLQGLGVLTAHKVDTPAAYAARVGFLDKSNVTNKEAFEHKEVTYTETSGVLTGNKAGQSTGVEEGQWSYLTTSKGLEISGITNDSPNTVAIYKAEVFDEDEDTNYQFSVSLVENLTTGYFEANVTVRIWIEGWDADAYDSIYNSKLDVSLTFAKTATIEP